MDESATDLVDQSENPLVLASVVAEQVEIDAVLLAESRTRRSPTLGLTSESLNFKFEISSISFGREAENKKFYIVPSFVLKSTIGENEDPDENLLIEATFVLTYRLRSFEGIEDKHLQAYGSTNGIFNAWPFWREFVQSISLRMGIPPIAVPVFRL